MKTHLFTLILTIASIQPAVAMTETGWDDIKFGALIGLNVLVATLALICFLVPAAVFIDRVRKRKRQRAIMKVTANSRDRLSKQGLANRAQH